MKQTFLILFFALCANTFTHAQLISGSLIVNEINYNSDSTTESGDWFELFNTSSSDVNIGGWSIRDSDNANIYTFLPGTVVSGSGYLVVVNDIPAFTAFYPTV